MASANPIGHYPVAHHEPTVIQTHAQTYYAPITQTKYGSQVNHLVPVPEPIIKVGNIRCLVQVSSSFNNIFLFL